MRFADTNILLYSISTAIGEQRKAGIAIALLSSKEIAISVQVLQEFYVQATRTSRSHPLPHAIAVEFIEKWRRFQLQEITLEIMRAALDSKERWGISYWNASILEAARAAGCREVLSEDLSHGQNYGGILVTNPFIC
jgi:predicted nucleic acid-binding protein